MKKNEKKGKDDLFKSQFSKLNQDNKILLGLISSSLCYLQTLGTQDIVNFDKIILKRVQND